MDQGEQKPLRGHCLCGACRFELTGTPLWVGHCYCESCRRATASAFTTWIVQVSGGWTLGGDAPATYESSPGTWRGFCRTCGTPMFYRPAAFPEETHFYAALLENPADVMPTAQCHADERLPWIHLADGLPEE